MQSKFRLKNNTIIPLAILSFAFIVFASQWIQARFDLTAEKRFSLHDATRQMLAGIDTPIYITILLDGDLPADYQQLKQATTDILSSFKNENPSNIIVQFEKPGEGLPDSSRFYIYDSLQQMGVAMEQDIDAAVGTDAATQRIIFPAAILHYANKYPVVIDLRSSRKIFRQFNVVNEEPQEDKDATLNAAEALLEYKFANAIDKLTTTHTPVIAYTIGNGEPIDLTINDLGESLRNQYRLAIYDLTKTYPDPRVIDLLLVVKPIKPFSDEEKLKLDQYVMHGGKIIWCVDKLYAEIDSLMRSQADFVAYDRNLNLDDLFFKYGVRIQNDLLQDLNCSKLPVVVGENPDGSARMQRIPWAYYPFLQAPVPNAISSNLDRVLSIFPSGMDKINVPGLSHTILLSTDTNSRRMNTPAIVSLNSVKDDNDLAAFNAAHIPVAMLVEGKFESLYANRLTPAVQDSVRRNLGAPFLKMADQAGQQIFCSDADLVTNVVSPTTGPLAMGELPLENYRFANKAFFLNCVDYLVSNSKIFETRNKDFTLRVLNKQKVQEEKTIWQFINIGIPLLLIFIITFLFKYRQQKKFTAPHYKS